MSHIIDNRGKNTSHANRSRYIQKENAKIKKAVREYVDKTKIRDMANGKDVVIDVSKEGDDDEYNIGYDSHAGNRDFVYSHNGEHHVGDYEELPKSGQGRGKGGSDSDDGSSVDYKFHLTAKEFMDLLFEELELPKFIKKAVTEEKSTVLRRAGFVSDGAPSRLNILRTFKNSLGRTLSEKHDYLDKLEKAETEEERLAIEEEMKRIPLFREVDLRFSNLVADPVVQYKGVMFCLMDVSGSMGEAERLIAKQFFLILYIFLRKCYTSVEVVFIQHTSEAEEVDEDEFFNSDKSGGTMMSSALELMDKIIKERYNLDVYNVYGAHVCDAGNFDGDNKTYIHKLKELLPVTQFFIYIEAVLPSNWMHGSVSRLLNDVRMLSKTHDNLQAQVIKDHRDIWKSFVKLFEAKGESSNG